jgi:hypothetical protein
MSSKNSLSIYDYYFIQKPNSLNGKKNKKKLINKKYPGKIKIEEYINLESDFINILKKILIDFKKHNKNNFSAFGIILDKNVIIHNIAYLPPTPTKFDILCVESDINSYLEGESNIYWCKTNIKNSGNFIINKEFIDPLLNWLKEEKSLTLSDFWNFINNFQVYSITQYQLSEPIEKYVHHPSTNINSIETLTKEYAVLEEQYTKSLINLIKDCPISLNVNVNSDSDSDNLTLPKISLICPIITEPKLFHTIMTFLYLDYPKDLLELIIIDDTNSEKKLNLPEDKRIRLINTNPKDAKTINALSLGYKLNLGVKYASNNIICHFFNNNHYINFKENILTFLISKKELSISKDIGIKYENKTKLLNFPDISSLIYYKTFWTKQAFEEVTLSTLNDTPQILYKFIMNRKETILFKSFISSGFKIYFNPNEKFNLIENYLNINCDLLIDKKLQESLKITFV